MEALVFLKCLFKHICYHFQVRAAGECIVIISSLYMSRIVSYQTFIKVIVMFLLLCFQSHLRHQFLHSLMIDIVAFNRVKTNSFFYIHSGLCCHHILS